MKCHIIGLYTPNYQSHELYFSLYNEKYNYNKNKMKYFYKFMLIYDIT